MDEIFKEEHKDKHKNEIKYNVEPPKLITAPQKEENHIPNPEEDKKQFQEKRLDQVLKKKGDSRMRIRRRALVLDPEEYQPKQIGEKHAPAYQEEKEKNLQEESMAQNRLSRFNVEKDREIKRSPHTPEEALAAEMKKLDQYASEKQAFMLKVNTDPLEEDYIAACVQLDKVVKAYEITEKMMKDGQIKKEALQTLDDLKKKAETNVKKAIIQKEQSKAIRETSRKRKEATKERKS